VEGPPPITYLFTTFPKDSEQFLQREVRLLGRHVERLKLVSIHRGGGDFSGFSIARFPKIQLLTLVWWIPFWAVCRPRGFFSLLMDFFKGRPPDFLNVKETLLGLAYALVRARHFQMEGDRSWIHATWATMPASAALGLHRLTGKA
jgi:hypothetical protein